MKRKLEDVNGGDNLRLLSCSQSQKRLYLNNYYSQLPDYLSQLPEEIIVNILSSMKLKDAVQNTILSHSLKNACASLTSIIFDSDNVLPPLTNNLNNTTEQCCCMDHKQKFVTCVNQYLQFNQATYLDFFKIHFCFQLDDKEVIHQWLRIILSRDVDCLQLIFCCPKCDIYLDTNTRPLKWYSLSAEFSGGLSKVTHLCLGGCQFDKDFIPNFNRLTSLDLRRVVFKNCDLQSLLHSMPNLESLYVHNTVLPAKLSFHCLPFLKILRLFNCHSLKEMELRSDVLHWLYLKVKRVIKLNWNAIPNITTIGVPANEDGLQYILTHFPAEYPFLRLLTVFSYSDWGSCIPDSVSKFSHLQFLKLYFYSDYAFDILKLIHVLRAFPHLARLGLLTNCTTEVERSEVEIGEFSLHSLEEVHIRGTFSTPSQIELIIYLLKSAPALKVMNVWKTKNSKQVAWDQGQREHIYKCIQEALKGRRNVKVKMFP